MSKGGDAAKGALGGAATGATIGSVAGPYGTAIGAGVGAIGGGLLGYFGSNDDAQKAQQDKIEQYRQMIMSQGFDPVQAKTVGAPSGFRTNQQDLIKRLDAASQGRGPSIADEQLKQSVDRNTSLQQSMAQSGRGNATLANIVAANNSNNFGQGAAQTAVASRLQEQQMANQLYGQVVGQARGQDEQISQFNAQQQNFAAQANLEAKLRLMGLDDDSILKILQMQQSATPTGPGVGDQILAGGSSALGMWAANQRKNTATPSSSVFSQSNLSPSPTVSDIPPGFGA